MEQGTQDSMQVLIGEVKALQAIVAENNTILKKIQRRDRFILLVSSLKWIIIIGLSLGSFYFLKPLFDTYQSFGLGNVFQNTLDTEINTQR